MDFGKVKILLIIVFLGLNLFLVYQWSVLGKSVSMYTEPFCDQVANIKRTFAGHGVTMNANLPSSPDTLPMVMVDLSPSWFANAVELGLSVNKKHPIRHSMEIRAPKGSAVWEAPDQVRFVFNRKNAVVVIKSDGQLDGLHKWLLRHVYNFNDYQLFAVHLSQRTGVVAYVETVNSYGIFSAPLVIDINQGKIVRITQYYLDINKSIRTRPVMTAANAMLALASYMDKAHLEIDNTVGDMQLGYASRILTTSSGYLSPVWRISSARGYFYVNALNGEVSVQSQ